MLDLSSIDIDTVTESQFYTLLVVFNESIRLKRNVIYKYQLTVAVQPTIEEPDPAPEVVDVYFYINTPYVDINISELELALTSISVSDYGITGERLNIVTAPYRVLTGSDIDAVEFDEFSEIFSEEKYDYLRSVPVSDLSFAKNIFYTVGKEQNWPTVSASQAEAIAEIISDYEENFDDAIGDADLEITLNSVKLAITRLFDPNVVPDEMM